jgi:two-component system, chemotaxis family, CheB/CheR fusion protein
MQDNHNSKTCKSVLVVDDDAESVAMLSAFLDLEGHGVHVAANGWQAIQSAAELEPDVILLDLSMPEMNGYEAARRIRDLQLPRRPLIVAATGRNGASDRMACVEAGIDVHLAKPLELDVLGRLLAS